MIAQKIFFFTVFIIQMIIAIIDYILAYRCYANNDILSYKVNVLAGISWTATGLYKLWEFYIC